MKVLQGMGTMGIHWTKLFSLQRELDNRIMREHQLTGDYFSERLLALQVEVAELANETRCFKYWSVKPPSERSQILEEYVDGIHFILSIGLTLGFQTFSFHGEHIYKKKESIVEQFLTIYQCIAKLQFDRSRHAYETLVHEYVLLGFMLGFSEQDMETAYMKKNEINHERQEQGY